MRVVYTLLACLLLAACSGVEFKRGEKSHARREIPPGPGLLTGKQGEFVIFRVEDTAKDETGKENEQDSPEPEAPK